MGEIQKLDDSDLLTRQASRETHGVWMCLINDSQTFTAVKRYVTLHVGIEAKSSINIDGGDVDYRYCRPGQLTVDS